MSAREDEITEWFARQSNLNITEFPIGIGDDMAEIRVPRAAGVLITTDMLLEGVHFDLEKATLEQVGYKAVAVSLSDCAAMATVPLAVVLSVALPAGFREKQLKQLHSGISTACQKYNCPLAGGDINSWKDNSHFVISSAMLSRPAACSPVTRSGAKVSDFICVTGSLGGAISGRHLNFEPRVKEAIKLTQLAHLNSMIDISDGLSSDLNRICKSSKVGAMIEADSIPLSPQAREAANPLDSALNDGEDFELLFTLTSRDYKQLLSRWDLTTPVTRIGKITDTGKMQIKTVDGKIDDLKPKGFEHLGNPK